MHMPRSLQEQQDQEQHEQPTGQRKASKYLHLEMHPGRSMKVLDLKGPEGCLFGSGIKRCLEECSSAGNYD